MTVTKIEAVAKVKYRVYIDEQPAFLLYKGEVKRYRLTEGQEITQEAYREILEEILLKRARLRAMHLLNDMGRTEAQLKRKLEQGEYPEEIIEKAISYVKSYGYINDLNYAKDYVDSRKNKKSRKEIALRLHEKGISKEYIEQAFHECYDREDSLNAIEKLMEKRRYHAADAGKEEKQKLMAYLMRKGFSYEDVRLAVEKEESVS